MISFKIDILQALKNAGYSSYRLRQEKIIGERVIQKIRDNGTLSTNELNIICRLLQCQPGDILQYIPDPEQE